MGSEVSYSTHLAAPSAFEGIAGRKSLWPFSVLFLKSANVKDKEFSVSAEISRANVQNA